MLVCQATHFCGVPSPHWRLQLPTSAPSTLMSSLDWCAARSVHVYWELATVVNQSLMTGVQSLFQLSWLDMVCPESLPCWPRPLCCKPRQVGPGVLRQMRIWDNADSVVYSKWMSKKRCFLAVVRRDLQSPDSDTISWFKCAVMKTLVKWSEAVLQCVCQKLADEFCWNCGRSTTVVIVTQELKPGWKIINENVNEQRIRT